MATKSQCTYRCVVLPDPSSSLALSSSVSSQCTYRCVVLPDSAAEALQIFSEESQCTYRCVVLPDTTRNDGQDYRNPSLNAPTGAWCSLTRDDDPLGLVHHVSMHLQVRGAP